MHYNNNNNNNNNDNNNNNNTYCVVGISTAKLKNVSSHII